MRMNVLPLLVSGVILLSGCNSGREGTDLLGDLNDPETLQVLPSGWSPFGGGGPDGLAPLCVSGIDQLESSSTSVVLTVRCPAEQASYGGLWRSMDLARFQGKSARLSAQLRAASIESIQGEDAVGALWLRIETATGPIVGNMRDRGIRGSTDWEYREGIVEIPSNANAVMVGFWMQGRGELSIKDFRFEEVSADVEADFSAARGRASVPFVIRAPNAR